MTNGFEPKILYILCSWCGTGGAETASAHGLRYPENVRIYRVNCTGSLPTVHVLRALVEGADGVAVSGCHPGDCHYQSGNYKARRRVAILNEILDQMGLEKGRVWLRWISASEGQYFADTVTEMVAALKEMGPNPAKDLWAT